jgi:hypothetical protein
MWSSPDDVRAVFDRLLATDTAIEQAQHDQRVSIGSRSAVGSEGQDGDGR